MANCSFVDRSGFVPSAPLLLPRPPKARLRVMVSKPKGSTGDVMSNLGVFGWIRESVKRSVLLGFSDAVEQLGNAADPSDPIHPQLAAVLRQAAPPLALTEAPQQRPAKSERKRLGRSLEQLRAPAQAPRPQGA
jgi:hypothetical protein